LGFNVYLLLLCVVAQYACELGIDTFHDYSEFIIFLVAGRPWVFVYSLRNGKTESEVSPKGFRVGRGLYCIYTLMQCSQNNIFSFAGFESFCAGEQCWYKASMPTFSFLSVTISWDKQCLACKKIPLGLKGNALFF